MARIPILTRHHRFPDPRSADAEGLVAAGGDFAPDRLLQAYRRGIFPWPCQDHELLWFSPDPRLIFEPARFHVSRRLAREIRRGTFEIRLDTAFADVMRMCGEIPRRDQEGTWITKPLRDAFAELHRRGHAHSVEVWRDGVLVGGTYGLELGRAFFAESMFSAATNASKVALTALCRVARDRDLDLIDAQLPSDHLLSLGGIVVPRDAFLDRLDRPIAAPTCPRPWAWPHGGADWASAEE